MIRGITILLGILLIFAVSGLLTAQAVLKPDANGNDVVITGEAAMRMNVALASRGFSRN